MNSMYGWFGMHTPELKHAIVNSQQLTDLMQSYAVLESISFGDLDLVSYALDISIPNYCSTQEMAKLREFLKGLTGQTNVPIAAAVTAYSRMIINEYKLLALSHKLDIFYSDTDSLVVNGVLPPEVCDSAKLGQLKLEHKFREGIFPAPKIYYLKLEDGSTVTKCKGYSKELSREQYLNLTFLLMEFPRRKGMEGKHLDLSVTRWTRCSIQRYS